MEVKHTFAKRWPSKWGVDLCAHPSGLCRWYHKDVSTATITVPCQRHARASEKHNSKKPTKFYLKTQVIGRSLSFGPSSGMSCKHQLNLKAGTVTILYRWIKISAYQHSLTCVGHSCSQNVCPGPHSTNKIQVYTFELHNLLKHT